MWCIIIIVQLPLGSGWQTHYNEALSKIIYDKTGVFSFEKTFYAIFVQLNIYGLKIEMYE